MNTLVITQPTPGRFSWILQSTSGRILAKVWNARDSVQELFEDLAETFPGFDFSQPDKATAMIVGRGVVTMGIENKTGGAA